MGFWGDLLAWLRSAQEEVQQGAVVAEGVLEGTLARLQQLETAFGVQSERLKRLEADLAALDMALKILVPLYKLGVPEVTLTPAHT